MQKQRITVPEFKLVGLNVRTNNQNEMNPETGKIGKLAGSFWQNQTANLIKHRSKAGITYSAYTDYASDEHGDYTYFIGEVVDSFEDQDLSELTTLTIPASTYQKCTTEPGKMPEVVISAWQQIWTMTESDLQAKRKYITDFELYDQRAADPNNTIVDIYIGVED